MNAFEAEIAAYFAQKTSLSAEDAARLLETPPDPELGDYAFPCFRLAKEMRKAPAKIAEELSTDFPSSDRVRSATAAGPYVNFQVDRARFFEDVFEAAAEPLSDGEGKTIVLDYGSPNIAKHLAYHHLRSTCIGFSLKRIYTHLGYHAVGINHLGDWGTTHGKLIAAYRHWGQGLDLSTDGVTKLNELYVRFNREGDEEEGREWSRRLEEGDEEARELWERFREISMTEHREIFDLLGVTFDVIKGESEYVAATEDAIAKVEDAGLAVESEGALVVDLSELDMPPFFLRKANGATVYSTRDLAAALDRYDTYGFSRCLYVVDMGQSLHLKQLFTVLDMMGVPWADRMEHVAFGLVRFGGKKTGTRTGNVVLLRDVLTEAISRIDAVIAEKNPDLEGRDRVSRDVGVGAIIFADLSSRRVKDVEFVWEDILNFEGHTGPYVQYTHARCASIHRKARAEGAAVGGEGDPAKLALPEEWEIGKLLAAFPERVRAAGREAEPSIVAQYLLTLSEAFSRYYNLGNQDAELKVIAPDPGVSAARLMLTAAVRDVLARGLWLLGIGAPEQM